MPPKDKSKTTKKGAPSFKWDDNLTTMLLRICQEMQKKHGHGVPFNWTEIVQNFKEKTGLETTHKIARNKFEHIKRFWRTWDDLKNKETGVGWNEQLNTVKADDAWWDKKILEKPDYRRFRGGIDHDTTDLWTEVFAGIVVTGRRCVAPTMDPSAIPVGDDQAATEFDWEQDLEHVGADPLGTPINDNMTGFTKDDYADVDLPDGGVGGSGTSVGSQQTGKRTPTVAPKRKVKRAPSSQTLYNKHLEVMGTASEKFFAMMDDDEGSSMSKKGRKVHDLDDAMPVIEEMVEKGVIVEGGELWCVAMAELVNEDSC